MLWCLDRVIESSLSFGSCENAGKMPGLRPRLGLPRLEHGTTTLNPSNTPSCKPFISLRITDHRSLRPHRIIIAVAVASRVRLSKDTAIPSKLYRSLLPLPGCCFRGLRGLVRGQHHYRSGRHICANHHAIPVVKSWRGIARPRCRNATVRLDDRPKSNGDLFSTGFTVKPTAAAAERTLWLATEF